MYIIIMGCGRVGSQLTKVLALEGHDITVIDRQESAFQRLPKTFKGKMVTGIGFDQDILAEAGIERADAFIAVTNGDNSNIVGALVARNRFRVPKVVARIYDPVREKLYQHLGVQTISSTSWAANKIKDIVLHAHLVRHMSFGSGEVDLIEAEILAPLEGRRVADVNVHGEITVVTIVRNGHAFVPGLGTTFELGDGVQIVVDNSAIPKLKRLLHVE